MLRNLSIRTGLLTLLAVMAVLLLLVSAMGIYSLTQSSASLQRINALQGEKMMRLNEGYTLLLRARNEAGQAVRQMEIGMVDDATASVKTIAGELVRGQQLLKTVLT
ncbi:Tar ligand binding domain-containing protein, partial [Leptospira borgpetersenii serovar Hardjo-bovis]|nr:Tar ligand binding domain-containing protein [Leptospira borgpetersenii serovar Hardjo-bovis]